MKPPVLKDLACSDGAFVVGISSSTEEERVWVEGEVCSRV